jgi:putative colanic acid biosynthesis UDP-glucose lipid carrier transferase
MQRHKVKPGIIGWAQVNGWRGGTKMQKRVEHDLHTIRNWSLALDIKIVTLTLVRGFVRPGAY